MRKISLWSLLVIFLVMFVVGCGKSTSLEGKVVDGKGQPLVKVKVAVKMSQPIKGYEQFETTTGSDGTFKFGKLFPTSEYQLVLYSERGTAEKKIKTESGPEGQTKMLPDPVMIRFRDSNEGVVLDTKTTLMWASKDNGADINWANAKPYCENYRAGGYTDWRVPTQVELTGLLIDDKGYNIDLKEFISLTGNYVWASDTHGSVTSSLDSIGGVRYWDNQSGINANPRALPVRSGK